jgi:hypothetical protein
MGTTFPSEVIERVGAYIRRTAAKDAAELHNILQEGHDKLAGLLDGMSEEQARWQPAPSEWSALQLMHHVVSAKGGVARICQRLATGDAIPGRGREGDEQDGITRGDPFASIAEARAAMDVAHAGLVAFVDGPFATGNTEVRFNHFVFGDLNSREWAAFQRVHDGDHSGQIEKIIAGRGYPA